MYVIANPNSSAGILALADQTSNKLNFNGDDPVQLIKVLNNIPINIDSIEGIGGNPHAIFDTLDLDTIDHIGIPGVWPGNQGYSVGSGTTKNSTLIRKAGVTTGKEDWACGQKQWRVNGTDDYANLKQHQCKCGTAITVSFVTSASAYNENTVSINLDLVLSGIDPDNFVQVWVIHNPFSETCIDPYDPLKEANSTVDYSLPQGSIVSWNPGESGIKSIKVDFIDDAIDELDEYICFEIDEFMSDVSAGPNKKHKMKIIDNDVTGINEIDINNIKVYPSVAKENIFIKGIRDTKDVRISVHNVLGQEMFSLISFINGRIKVDISILEPGMYFLNLYDEDTKVVRRFIKE